jgi:hypothetical protein
LKSILATGEYLFIKTSTLVIIMDGCGKLLSVHVPGNGLLKYLEQDLLNTTGKGKNPAIN